jgi:hypothetical protein
VSALEPPPVEAIEVDHLHFDPANPRIPATVDKYSEPALIEWMLRDATLQELMGAIASNGYFRGEPLLVSPQDESISFDEVVDWIVVEGNRRLAAVKLLRAPDRAPAKQSVVKLIAEEAKVPPPDAIPAIRFEKRDEILGYLGFRHITGIKQWDPLAKARYLAQLRGRGGQSLPELARAIGSTRPYVGRLLTALGILEKLENGGQLAAMGVTGEEVPFSLLSTALNYDEIADFLNMADPADPDAALGTADDEHLALLASWIFEKKVDDPSRPGRKRTQLGESRSFRHLAAILQNETATQHLVAGEPVELAEQYTALPAQAFTAALTRANNELTAARNHLEEVEDPSEVDVGLIGSIESQAADLRDALSQRQQPN